jgi:hypothetical protein
MNKHFFEFTKQLISVEIYDLHWRHAEDKGGHQPRKHVFYKINFSNGGYVEDRGRYRV